MHAWEVLERGPTAVEAALLSRWLLQSSATMPLQMRCGRRQMLRGLQCAALPWQRVLYWTGVEAVTPLLLLMRTAMPLQRCALPF